MSEQQKTPMEKKKELRARVKELKPLIPSGIFKKVAEDLGLSRQIVSDVLAGRRWNLDIIEALIKIGEKELKRVDAALQKLDKIKERRKAAQKPDDL